MDKLVRNLVWERCQGLCEFCGLPLQEDSFDFHHRQLVTKIDLPSNGIAVHSFCHIQTPYSIHQNPQTARERGFIIAGWVKVKDFSAVPLSLYGGSVASPDRWVCLDNFGNYAPFMVDTPVTNG